MMRSNNAPTPSDRLVPLGRIGLILGRAPLGSLSITTLASLFISPFIALPCYAQEQALDLSKFPSVTTTQEGVSGYSDKKDRDPTLSVTAVSLPESAEGGARVKLLAYAEVLSHEFKEFPIRFEFFVNQKMLSSQIRSVELPGPIGVDVTKDIATQPFNYTVIATVLHPNRQFTSVLNGASFATDLATTLDCSLTIAESDEDERMLYQANGVEATQDGNNVISLKFDAERSDGEEDVNVDATITLETPPGINQSEDIAASASITTVIDDSARSTILDGAASFEAGAVAELSFASSDDLVTLDCSPTS